MIQALYAVTVTVLVAGQPVLVKQGYTDRAGCERGTRDLPLVLDEARRPVTVRVLCEGRR